MRIANVPFNSETRDTRLLSKNIATNLLDDRLSRRVGVQFLRLVFVVHVISNAYKFATVIGASQQNDSDTNDLSIGDSLGIRGIGFENKFVDADRNGTDQQGVELLVILVRGSRADVSQLPLKICVATSNQYVARSS